MKTSKPRSDFTRSMSDALKLMKKKQYAKALPIYQKITKKYPDDYKSLTNLGNVLIQLNKPKAAVDIFKKALKLNKKIPVAHYQIGIYLAKQNNSEKSIEEFNLAIKYDSTFWNAWYAKGLSLFSLGKYNSSLQCFEKSIKINPKLAISYYYKGLILAIKSKFKESITAVNLSTTLQPKVARYWVLQGRVYDSLNDCPNAENAFEKAIQLDPNNSDALHHKGMVLGNDGKIKESIPFFRKSIKLDPRPIKFYNLGLALYELKKYSEAISPIKKSLQSSPNNVLMLTQLGISLEESGKLKESLIYFKRAAKLQPDYQTLTNLGVSYGKQHELKKSLYCFKQAEKINPKDEILLLNIAITSNTMKNYKTMLDYANRIIEQNETSIVGWIQKTLSLSKLKKIDAALNALSVAISLNPMLKQEVKTNSDFQNLQKYDRFKKLVS